MNYILSAKMEYLIKYAKDQFSQHKGLHLNSADWKPYIWVSDATFYKFLINGTIYYRTKTKPYDGVDNHKYEQIIRLPQQNLIQPALMILFLLNTPEDDIVNFMSAFFSESKGELRCNDCGAFKYWGISYNLTKIGSIYGPKEFRPPKIRDPKHQNLVCKHLWLILLKYESQIKNFSKLVLPYYKRALGLTTKQAREKLIRQMDQKEIKKLAYKAAGNVTRIKSDRLSAIYKQLVNGKIDSLMNAETVKNNVNNLADNNNTETKTEDVINNINTIANNVTDSIDGVSNEE